MNATKLNDRCNVDEVDDEHAHLRLGHSASEAGVVEKVGQVDWSNTKSLTPGTHPARGFLNPSDKLGPLTLPAFKDMSKVSPFPAAPQPKGDVLPFKPALRIALSGVMGVGIDYVAKNLDCVIFGFADPMYDLAVEMLGTSDKSVPGVRKFLQTIGAWGRGDVTLECPLSVERALFVERMRHSGYTRFGKDSNYWVRQCLDRIAQSAEPRIAVTNARFANEAKALSDAGFQLLHAVCHADTLASRRQALGYTDTSTFTNVSEAMAMEFDRRFFADEPLPEGYKVYWNDPGLRPEVHNNAYYN